MPMEYEKPILRRYKGIYIEINDNVARCTESPLNEAYSRLQYVKTDGQGNKFVTYRKKKIVIDPNLREI